MRTLTLQDVNVDGGLIVIGGAEDFTLLVRNRRVARNQRRHHTAQRFETQRQRRHVEQQHVLHFAAQHTRLNGRTDRHHFIGIDALVGLFAAGQFAHQLLHHRHARRAADQHHFVDITR